MAESSDSQPYVKLVSASGHEIFLLRSIAMSSVTIKAMLEGPFAESQESKITFPDINTQILEKVVEYLHYKVKYTDSTTRIPDFVIEPEIALELLVAANYLDC
eukprot:CAMPEP_0196811740 /NCGR_PEP_ID=MMETSP1362-20130617/20033_1 /TAXON_ID=163516 /ORGANISM="Leptocylindrus danicus, Strain CCMP1856" /LENGTH=102 /DNA_ID=CAMNT_0042187119 /DNA_START=43 /DNA_END=351 /DNA_ORIENTATION=+